LESLFTDHGDEERRYTDGMTSLLDDPAISLARLSVAQYHQMVATGVLIDGDPLELYEGVLVEKMTEGPAHSFRITQLARLLFRLIGDGDWQVRVQHPISTDDSEPEPDLAIVADHDYSQRHPGPTEVLVIIEVAGSSLARDRSTKQRIYANAGIAHYVIVNLTDDVVESYSQPIGGDDARYGQHVTLTAGTIELGPITVDVASLRQN
jgi:Uma2 family endonuclease